MSATCWLCGGLGNIAVFARTTDETGQVVTPVWVGCRASIPYPPYRHGRFCPACALAKVNEELRAYGIEYPLGPRGVRDLRGFATRYFALLAELAEVAGLSGDFDDWPEQLRAKLAACQTQTPVNESLSPGGSPTSPPKP